MGFHVECSGAELLHRLRRDASGFLGEPYSLYFIALATELDDEAIMWLKDHEMQLDSLCGPTAAFLLFYNQAALIAEPFPRPWAPTSLTPEEKIVEIEVNPSVLNGGYQSVDKSLRFDPRADTDKDILVRAMTYESDTIAREFGIERDLPCIIIFDDPASEKFYTFPLEAPDKNTMQDLRRLFDSFCNDKKHSSYLKMLRDWHSENSKLEHLLSNRRKLLVSRPHGAIYIYAALGSARDLLMAGKAREFLAAVNRMASESDNVGRLPSNDIRRAANEIARANSLLNTVRSHEAAEDLRAKAIKRATKLMDLPEDTDADSVASGLRARITNATDEALGVILRSLDLVKLDSFTSDPVQQIDKQIRAQNAKLELIARELASKPRPSLSKHFAALQQQNRLSAFVAKTKKMAVETSPHIPPLLDAVKRGLELFTGEKSEGL